MSFDFGRNHWIDLIKKEEEEVKARINYIYAQAVASGVKQIKKIIVSNIYSIPKSVAEAWKKKGIELVRA